MEQTIEKLLQEGMAAHNEGKLQDADRLYRLVLKSCPNHPDANHNLGLLAASDNKTDIALPFFKAALEALPKEGKYWVNYIDALIKEQQFENARQAIQQANQLGLDDKILHAWEKKLAAITSGRGENSSSPSQRQISNLLHHYRNGRFSDAEGLAISITKDFPLHQFGWKALGAIRGETGRIDESLEPNRMSVQLAPNDAQAHYNLGITLKKLGELSKAEACYKQAIALKQDHAEAFYNLGIVLKELGRLDEAASSYQRAIVLKPSHAEANNNLGNIFKETGRLDEAEAYYKQAIALKPDYAEAHHNLSLILLNSGRLKEGLDENEWRLKVAHGILRNRQFPHDLWDIQKSLQGKRILLWSEQGIGDTLNWASCLPLVASLAEHTILECQEKIVPLLARSFPNIEVKPEDISMDAKRDDFDFHLPMGSLYRQFFPNIGEHSNIDAYLIPDPARVQFWRQRLSSLGKGPYIGISWKSSKTSPFRQKHYPPILEWSNVLTVPDVTFINLQYSDFTDDLNDIKNELGVTVHNFDDLDHFNEVDDVVALCASLDMVVSTKVTPLIFSSGVGTPTKVANWRQSIWNSVLTNPVCSSAKMFHRDTWEPWDNVFKSIAEDILRLKDKIAPHA